LEDPLPETLDIPLPHGVTLLAEALSAAGHGAVVVGGLVRDALLGRDHVADVDLATDATPAQVRAAVDGAPWLDSLWDVGERWGTLGLIADGTQVEVSTFRAAEDLRPDADVAARFAADAAHRDLTVNALGLALPHRALLDPTGGHADLDARVLRAVGDPTERLAEDPLRVLRVARLAAQLEFDVEPRTAAALAAAAPALARVSPERTRDELTKLLTSADPDRGLRLLRDSGALAVVLPEVAELVGLDQPPRYHDLDGFEHTLAAVTAVAPDPVMRWAALLHDIGKPGARSIDDTGRVRFHGHASAGIPIAEEILGRLVFSKRDTMRVRHLVGAHMVFNGVDLTKPRHVDRAVRKADLWLPGPHGVPELVVSAEEVAALKIADRAGHRDRDMLTDWSRDLNAAVAAARARGVREMTRSPVSGDELRAALKLDEGPLVGAAKHAIEDAVRDGKLAEDDKAGALKIARKAVKRATGA